MISLGSPVPKRSRLSLNRSSTKVAPLANNDAINDTHLKQIFSNSDVSVLKRGTNFKSDIDNPSTINDSSAMQDENQSPNVLLLPLEPKYCAQVTSQPEQDQLEDVNLNKDQSEIVNLIKDQSESFVLGLPNCGNTCYVNSVLQVLRYTPSFLNSLHNLMALYNHQKMLGNGFQEDSDAIFFQCLHKLYIAMRKQDILVKENPDEKFNYDELMDPVECFLASHRNNSPQFSEDEQQDAHEFLLTIISSFSLISEKLQKNTSSSVEGSTESEISGNSESSLLAPLRPMRRRRRRRPFTRKRNKGSNLIMNFVNRAGEPSLNERFCDGCSIDSPNLNLVFEGKLCQIVKCLECETKIEREEIFSDIDVPIAAEESSDSESVLLTNCLSQSTILTGDNKYYCSTCVHLNEAKLSSEVTVSPSVLILHISWLSQSSKITELQKSNTKILIPLSLHTSKDCELFSRLPEQNYKLYAIILHIGASALRGHYVCFVNISVYGTENLTSETNTETDKLLYNEVGKCCRAKEMNKDQNFSNDNSSWFLIDDEKVLSVDVTDMNSFPYLDYLGATATPCMIFYQRN